MEKMKGGPSGNICWREIQGERRVLRRLGGVKLHMSKNNGANDIITQVNEW